MAKLSGNLFLWNTGVSSIPTNPALDLPDHFSYVQAKLKILQIKITIEQCIKQKINSNISFCKFE